MNMADIPPGCYSSDEWAALASPKPKRTARAAEDFGEDNTTFLWFPYLPVGDYAVMMADGGTGKTILCCGIAAVIYAARFNSASDGAGVGGDFNGAVCSIIGGNALYGGHGGMVQVLIGTITFGLITNILQLLGVDTNVQYIVQGAVLLLAINLDHLKKR